MIDLRLALPGTSWLDAKLEGHPAGDAPVHVLNTIMAPLRVENGDRAKVVGTSTPRPRTSRRPA